MPDSKAPEAASTQTANNSQRNGEPAPLEAAPLAYENSEFLDSPDGRPLRIMSEYTEPMARFRRERIQDTVVFFGSARFRELDVASHELELLDNTGSAQPAPEDEQPAKDDELASSGTTDLKRERAQAAVEMARYYEDARSLARLVTEWSKTLPGRRHRFVITSGGGPGIMEAANRGAWEAGGKTIGLNIKLPFEQLPNPYITPALNLNFHYFFMRKYWFAYLAKALVVFPGGFGTMDEMFELLTLDQTHKLAKKITIVIYGSSYWKQIINMEMLAEKGAISPKDLDLFQFADTPEEAFQILKDGLTKYHLDGAAPDATATGPIPNEPAPDAEELLGPGIARTRP
ncbi:MAG TPA: TIGR00730 family Rossman fold protein [Acidobacteriaceae bacterium]